jgi:hypothetical protein
MSDGWANKAMHPTAAVGRLRLPRAAAGDGQAVGPRPGVGPAQTTRFPRS